MFKLGKNDIKANIKFETDELELLQENSYQMAESFGLDRRIENLTGKRKAGFYLWDLDCLEGVVGDLKTKENAELTNRLYGKIIAAMEYIESHRNKK